ncbi:MAG: AraC family transcriptional regulator [Prevotella sp.]|nr:AraC family transcriptional regulator [Prevotella sp.]
MRYQQYDKDSIITNVRELVEKKKMYRKCHLTSTFIAKELGISRSTLSIIINNEMKTTFTDYINRCRIEYAQRLMQKNKRKLTLEEISFLAGFSCPSSFYRQYKKIYGTTPKECTI